jgi:hypothetical protein
MRSFLTSAGIVLFAIGVIRPAYGDQAEIDALRLHLIEIYGERSQVLQDRLQIHWMTKVQIVNPNESAQFAALEFTQRRKGDSILSTLVTRPVGVDRIGVGIQKTEMSYDGHETMVRRGGHLTIAPGDMRKMYEYLPDFEAHQLYRPDRLQSLGNRSDPSWDLRELLADSNYTIEIVKSPSQPQRVRLRGPKDLIELDPAQGYAVSYRAAESLHPETREPLFQVHYSYGNYKQVQPGFWVAFAIIAEYRNREVVSHRVRMDVQRFSLKPPGADFKFRLDVPRDSYVVDMREELVVDDGERTFVSFRTPEQDSDLDDLAKEAALKQRAEAEGIADSTYSTTPAWIAGGIVAAVLILLAVRTIRH